MAGGDAVDFVFDRAGVGVDIDAGGVQEWRHRLGFRRGTQRLLPGCTRGTPSEAELRAKQRMERACHGILFAYDYGQKSQPNQGKQA
jgi:hypothetical protein